MSAGQGLVSGILSRLAVFVFSSSWIGPGDLGELRWTALLVFVGNRFPNLFLFFGCSTEVGVAKRTNTTRKDSSGKRTNDVSPEAAARLAEDLSGWSFDGGIRESRQQSVGVSNQ
jgi:hypothetical protein